MSETKTKNLCTVPAADLTDSQYFIAEDGGELKRIPKAQVVLKKLENMLATDTENLAGGGEVIAQELLDAIAERVANKLLAKSQVVNNLLATVEGNPLDATQGKALKELIDTTNNNLSDKFAAKDISDGSLNQITTTGFYFGSNITEVTPYIKSHMWCLINAYVSGNSASIFVIAGNAMALSIYRNGDGIYSYYPIATKSDLDLKLNNTSIFVGNGEDFGQAIKKAGIVQLNKVGFFICNNPSNSPLGNGFIILAHNLGYWSNHPMYIKIDGSSISCGTLNCSDYTHITKD